VLSQTQLTHEVYQILIELCERSTRRDRVEFVDDSLFELFECWFDSEITCCCSSLAYLHQHTITMRRQLNMIIVLTEIVRWKYR